MAKIIQDEKQNLKAFKKKINCQDLQKLRNFQKCARLKNTHVYSLPIWYILVYLCITDTYVYLLTKK